MRRGKLTGVCLAVTSLALLGTTWLVAAGARADLKTQMHDNFARISAAQFAVVRGDLGAAVAEARWIADHASATGMPTASDAAVQALRAAAGKAVAAPDLAAVALATGEMAFTCGECHKSNVKKVAFVTIPAPRGDTPKARMRLHRWAVDMMTMGLTGPSDDLWTQGADALAGAPLVKPQPSGDAAHDGQVRDLEVQVHALAKKAAGLSDHSARAKTYGQIIASCGTCHSLHGLELGPGVPME